MKRLYQSQFLLVSLGTLVHAAAQVNSGAVYEERFGSDVFEDDPIPTELCEAGTIPDCLFGMDIGLIEISFNTSKETLKGFKMTFFEIDSQTGTIYDTFTCTHGSVVAGD